VSAVALIRPDALMDEYWRWFECDGCRQFELRYRAYAIGGCFFVPDYAAWHVPSGAEEAIAPPGQECPSSVVLNQQIDIDQRRDSADEQEYLLRQRLSRRLDVTLDTTN